MNSDEDPSFPFICEGPSGVLEIFGETTGVLPDMSTSSTVTDLEDVFTKGSIPIQATLKETNPQEKTSVEKNSANDVLSDFQDGSASLTATEDSKKTVQVENPAVLRTSVELTEEIQKVLVDATATLATESSVLVSVEESTKSIQEIAPAPVAGSVELAEEIMEAFANSKTVLDTENPVSTDNLQEELDRLEQLAVERVREIEGDLVNSSKEITECNLSSDVQKQSSPNEINNSLQKECISETVCTSEMAVSSATDIHMKDVGGNQSGNVVADTDLTSPSAEAVPEVKSADVAENKKAKPLSDVESSESTKDSVSAQENNTRNEKEEIREGSKSVSSSSKEVEKTANKTELKIKTDELKSELNQKANLKSSHGGNSDFETDVEKEKKQLVEQNNESKNDDDDDIQIVQEVVQEKPCTSDKSSSDDKHEEIKVDDVHKISTLETGKTPLTVGTVEETNTENKIKDMQNYETEDDDLEVLEAFIVKTATNPELAVCAVQPRKDDGTSKYSLESVLLDDLTKVDNGNSVNEVESTNGTVKDDSTPAEQTPDIISPQARLSLALERASQRITIDLDGSEADLNSKTKGNGARRRTGKQSSESTGKDLQGKKHHSQTLGGSGGKVRETGSSSDLVKGNNKSLEKKIVTVEVKRCRGKSLISRKTLSDKSSGTSRDNNKAEKITSEKFVSEKKNNVENALKNDQTTAARKSLRVPKKRRNSDDSMPSTSGIGLGKRVKEHSSQRSESVKRHKKQSEKNIENLTSNSKTALKGKAEEKPPIVLGTVDTTAEERKKSKDIGEKQSVNVRTNIEEKVTCSIFAQEGGSDKRNVEDVLHSSSLTSKTNKKEEKKVKEIIGTPVNKNVVKDGGNNTANMQSPVATRSMKRVTTKKHLQSPKRDEHKKEKNKENVEKLTPVGARDDKKQTEGTAKSQTLVAKSDKNDKNLEEKDHKSPLVRRGRRGVKRKTEENVEVSTSAVKQKRVEKEIQENLPDVQISPIQIKDAREKRQTVNNVSDSEVSLPTLKCTSKRNSMEREIEEIPPDLSCTSKQNRTEREIAESLQEVSITTVKDNTGESELAESLLGQQDSSTAVKRKRAVKENEESLPNLKVFRSALNKQTENEFEQNMPDRMCPECPGVIDSLTKNVQRMPDVLSDNLFFEFEDITFEMLRNKAKQLVLPTPLWGAQISTEKDLVVFSRMRADLSDDKPMIDKALVFQGSLKPIALINNEPVDLPIPCVRSFEDVVVLIRNFHTVSFCDGTGIKQRPHSKYCFRYLDVANPGQRCSQCLEERRRLLFACVRKLKERLRVMRAARNR